MIQNDPHEEKINTEEDSLLEPPESNFLIDPGKEEQ